MTTANKAPKSVKPVIDWAMVEKHFRAGMLSLREIAKSVDDTVTEGAIRKRAKKDGWTRNLAAKIAQKAEDLVRKEVVRTPSTQLTPASEMQVIEANAELQYRIRMEHRQDIGRTKSLFQKLLHELEQITDHQDLYEEIAELYDESGPDANGNWKVDKANELYRKIISLTGRVGNSKELVGMLEKLVKMEREAFGISGQEQEASSLDQLLQKIAAGKSA